MVACDASIQTLAFEAETAGSYNATAGTGWGEALSTMTYGVQLCSPVDFSGIGHDMIAPERVTGRRSEGSKGIVGPYSNLTISFESYLTGHGSATTDAVTLNGLYVLLGRVLGASSASSSSGTTLGAAPGTASVPITTASSTFFSGSAVRIGALGDTDGNGQFYAVSDHPSTTMNLLNAMDSAGVAGAVVYNAAIAYLADSACTMNGTRFRIQSADLQFVLHGGFPTSISFSGLNPGEVPKVSMTWQFSWAEPIAGTFPTTPNAEGFSPSANAADGSFHLQTFGTTTRALINVRQFGINYSLAVMPVMGGVGVNPFQVITGATRGRDKIAVSLVVDGEGADATPTYWDEWLTNPEKILVATLNSKATQAVGFICRRMVYTGKRPSQTNTGGRNTIALNFECIASTATGSDLTLSAFLIAGA